MTNEQEEALEKQQCEEELREALEKALNGLVYAKAWLLTAYETSELNGHLEELMDDCNPLIYAVEDYLKGKSDV